jgi:pimeloyl-ACP methyl ester carboxylesterase
MLARVDGTRIQYELTGPKDAPLVTLVHGFPFSRALWKGQLPALKKKFRVLSYDLRGMGATTLGYTPALLEAYVDDLFGLLNWIGVRRTALVGLSMGGYISLRAIQKAPERVWALGLCDTRAESDPEAARLGRHAGLETLRIKGVRAFVDGMLPKLLSPDTLKRRPAIVAGLRRMMLRSPEKGVANALIALAGRTDSSPHLHEIKVPTLILVGEEDAVTPPELSRSMARAIPKAKLQVLKGAGHCSNLEQPAAFNKALLSFLDRAKP